MTIDEINEKGGVLGRKLEPVVVDPASNWPLFAEKARDLIQNEKVAVTFGCWTSVSRKSVLPVFEELNGLLFYPVQYEGEESSCNVFYTGAAPNQQAIPAVEYLMSKKGGGAKRFVLLGTDYVYPRTTNKILRYFLHSKGIADDDIMEKYTPFGHSDYQTIVADIKKFAPGQAHRGRLDDQRRLERAVLQGARQPGPQGRRHAGRRLLGRRGRAARHRHQAAGRSPRCLELLHVDRHAREQGVHRQVEGLRQEEQPARRRQARHQRPDGSHVHRHPDVGAGGRAGAARRRRRRAPGRRLPARQGAVGLRRSDGRQEPPPAQAGRTSARSRPTASSRSCGRPKARSARRPGAPSSPTAPRRSPTGRIPWACGNCTEPKFAAAAKARR